MRTSIDKLTASERLIANYLQNIMASGIGTQERVVSLASLPMAFPDLCEWMAEIQERPELLQQLALDSYQHENGFSKLLVAWSGDDLYRLRFHLWPPRFTNANVHDHRFSFWSYVVEGRLTNRTWAVSKETGKFGRFSYKTQPGVDGHTLTFIGTAELNIASEDTIPAGSLYRINQDTLHTSDVEGDSPLTLVLEDRSNLKSDVTVLSTRYRYESQTIAAKRFSSKEYLVHAAKAMRILLARPG